MTSIKPAIAALITVGLLAAPFAAEAKKAPAEPASLQHGRGGPDLWQPPIAGAQPRTSYGSSGQSVGTVTAPSIGTYNWPSVGVTNSVPTWSNTTR